MVMQQVSRSGGLRPSVSCRMMIVHALSRARNAAGRAPRRAGRDSRGAGACSRRRHAAGRKFGQTRRLPPRPSSVAHRKAANALCGCRVQRADREAGYGCVAVLRGATAMPKKKGKKAGAKAAAPAPAPAPEPVAEPAATGGDADQATSNAATSKLNGGDAAQAAAEKAQL